MEDPTIQTASEPDRSPASANPPGVGAPVPPQAPEFPERTSPFGKPEGAPEVKGDLPNYQESWQSGDAGPGLSPKPSKWDKVMGGLAQGAHDSFAGTALRLYKEKSAETGTFLPPDQANQMNPYRTVPYTTPVDSGIVAMEAADGRRQQQIQEWMSRNEGGNFVHGAAEFAGGLVDAPMYAAIGLVTGGLGDLIAPEATGIAGKIAAHYGVSLAEFSGVGEVQNKLEAGMGAKEKPFSQVVQENLVGAGIATGLGFAARSFLDRGQATPEALKSGVKEGAAALANDEKLPGMAEQRAALQERKAGATQLDPNSEKVLPTIKSSPINETPLYAATHGDGAPLVHEHGLGPGTQLTDSHDVANNSVAKSTEIPGQIAETKLPDGTKLLDIDKPASEDYNSKESFLKQVEEKTGIPLDEAIKNGESIKDVIKNLGDWAGADIGEGKTVPEDILNQVQQIAKDNGFHGYEFANDNSRQVHMFDAKASGLELSNVTHADPSKVPDLPSGVPAADPNATPESLDSKQRQNNQNYSPAVQEALDKIRKTAMTLHPDNVADQITQVQNTLAEHEQLLQQMAKESPEAGNVMQELREQKAHDARMLDLAKRIMNCGAAE